MLRELRVFVPLLFKGADTNSGFTAFPSGIQRKDLTPTVPPLSPYRRLLRVKDA